MGRHAEGWRLRWHGKWASVRFTFKGQRVERGTGESDPERAAREAARIYADVVAGREKLRSRGSALGLWEAGEEWLADSVGSLGDGTRVRYEEAIRSHLEPHFRTLERVTTEEAALYCRARLSKVQAKTLRKELSVLRGLLSWCVEREILDEAPAIAAPSTRATGVRFAKRRRVAAPELSPKEIAKFLAALPVWSTSRRVKRFPVRARFVVMYETGLRPSTVDALSVPENFRKGAKTLRLFWEDDKGRHERNVPLTDTARRALLKVLPRAGVIFPGHDYRDQVRKAARKTLGEKADIFTGAHLRSARLTHMLEATGNLPGVQHLAGHRRASTTAIYVRASERAATEVIARLRPGDRS